jgi:hypothetical protein
LKEGYIMANRFVGGNRVKALERDKYLCVYCGTNATTVDHIIPWVYSRNAKLENLVAACSPCNTIASSFIFPTIQEKQKYILTERLKREKNFNWPEVLDAEQPNRLIVQKKETIVAKKKECVWCGKLLNGRKTKYCDQKCDSQANYFKSKGKTSRVPTDEMVRSIRKEYRKGLGPKLAKLYGYSLSTIYSITLGKGRYAALGPISEKNFSDKTIE